jgi:hypothetical protein
VAGISYIGKSASEPFSATAAAVTPALPSGWAEGDLLFLRVRGQFPTSSVGTWSTPTGWTLQAEASFLDFVGTLTNKYQLWSKVAEASESAPSIAEAPGGDDYRYGRVFAFRNATIADGPVNETLGASLTWTPSSVTASTNGMAVLFAFCRDDMNSDTASPRPANYQGWSPDDENGSPFKIGAPSPPSGVVFRKSVSAGSLVMPDLASDVSAAKGHTSFVLKFAGKGWSIGISY